MKADMVEKIVEKLEQNLNNSIHFRRMLLQKKAMQNNFKCHVAMYNIYCYALENIYDN